MTAPTLEPDVVPSRRLLAKATLVALAVATVVLVTTVLPAEYGIDALGTGRALGLLNIAASGAASAGGPIIPQANPYKVDTIEFLLIPTGTVEYKYRLETGATMLYTWKADGPLVFSMHTVPDGKPPDASEAFENGEKDQGHGSYAAPYAGLHGWYWENKGKESVTFRLTTAGFYTSATMFADGEQYPYEVKDIPPPPPDP